MPREEPSDRQRIDAFLAHAGLGTRSEVKKQIRRGRVRLDGVVCRRAAEHVDGREVRFDGRVVEPPPVATHLVFHKPVGYACSHDPAEAPIIDTLLPLAWVERGLQSAGRLDRQTSGLLILSTDGALVHSLTHPGRGLCKRYRVEYAGRLHDDAVARFAEGISLDERGATRPAVLVVEGDGRATVTLNEGRYHQVRRMFRRVGAEVVSLHRDRIGDYDLPDDLAPGAFRPLADEELDLLRRPSSL